MSEQTKTSSKPPAMRPPKKPVAKAQPKAVSLGQGIGYALLFAIWVVAAFIGSQLVLGVAIHLMSEAGADFLVLVNQSVLQTVVSVLVYSLSIAVTVGVPWLIWKKQRLTWKDVGFAEALPSWQDVGLAPVVFVLSTVAGIVAMFIASQVLPGVDLQTEQQVGFENLVERYEMLMGFITLVVLAPICEEVLFRGYLFGRIRQYLNAVWTVIITSLVFGALHVYAGPGNPLQWNVMINTVVLAFFIGALREYTGNVWSGILVHMLKNGVAFFVLFVMPFLGVSLL